MKGKNLAIIESFEIESKPRVLNTYLAAFSALLFCLNCGMLSTYPAVATDDMKKSGSRFINVTNDEITWIASLPAITSVIGTFMAGYASHKFGRKAVIMYITLPQLLGWLMVAYAPSIAWIYAGRVLSGIILGVIFVVVPAYIVEISPIDIRGLLTAGFQLSFSIGTFFMMTLGWALRWSWQATVGGILSVIATVLMLFMPESPAWLLRESRRSEAIASVKFLLGTNINVEKELQNMIDTDSTEQQPKLSWQDFINPVFYKPLIIAVLLFLFQQSSGALILSSYTVEIFKNTGSILDAQTSAVIFAGVQVIMSVLSSLLMDRAGRKLLFMISGGFISLLMCGLGVFCYLTAKGHDLNNLNWIPLVSLVLVVASYSIGFGPVPLVMTSELIPLHLRSLMITITIAIACGFTFALTKSFHLMVASMGYYGLFWTFSGCSLVGLIFGSQLPETKGRSIEEISKSFL